MTDYNNEFASRMPSIYGDKDKGGNYIRNFISVSDTANNMLKVYASLYDEIVKGYRSDVLLCVLCVDIAFDTFSGGCFSNIACNQYRINVLLTGIISQG